jgi:site-specific recombinase XerC
MSTSTKGERGLDYLVVGQVLAHHPAAAVRGPRLVIRSAKTPVREETEARALLGGIAGEGLTDRRDKALLAVMLYSFARVGAIVRFRVRDYENQRRRAYLALREKGGRHRHVPVHSRAAGGSVPRNRRRWSAIVGQRRQVAVSASCTTSSASQRRMPCR